MKYKISSQLFFLVALAIFLSGCISYHVNIPLSKIDQNGGYRVRNLASKENSKKLWIILAFSGGGTRAAAFSYGLLKELDSIQIEWDGKQKTLLSEVDTISSISGGSFTAAYYGLFRRRIFQEFEKKFLRANIQRILLGRTLSPIYWFRLISETYGRGDLAADYYDEILFEGKTFHDLAAKGRPAVFINATDMTLGSNFSFTQPYFDAICSNLMAYPISRAVTASSAFPVAFTPITILNFAGQCGYKAPPWVVEELRKRKTVSRRFHLARIINKYQDSEKYKYIHLLDGGITDNLGLRAPLRALTASGSVYSLVKLRGMENVRRVLIIVVDSKSQPERNWSQRPSVSGIVQMLNAATGAEVDRFSFESLNLYSESLKRWQDAFAKDRCKENPSDWCADIKMEMIHLSFDGFQTEEERKYFFSIPTSLALPDKTIDRLIGAPKILIEQNRSFQRILRELKAKHIH